MIDRKMIGRQSSGISSNLTVTLDTLEGLLDCSFVGLASSFHERSSLRQAGERIAVCDFDSKKTRELGGKQTKCKCDKKFIINNIYLYFSENWTEEDNIPIKRFPIKRKKQITKTAPSVLLLLFSISFLLCFFLFRFPVSWFQQHRFEKFSFKYLKTTKQYFPIKAKKQVNKEYTPPTETAKTKRTKKLITWNQNKVFDRKGCKIVSKKMITRKVQRK